MATVNLLPWREVRREERKRAFIGVFAGTVGLALLVIGMFHVYVVRQYDQQVARNHRLNTEISQLKKQLVEVRTLQKRKQELVLRWKIIQSLQMRRPQMVHLFDELVRRLPKGVTIGKAQLKNSALEITGYTESNSNISLLMRNITQSDWLAQPRLSEIKTTTQKTGHLNEFRLTAMLSHPGGEQKL